MDFSSILSSATVELGSIPLGALVIRMAAAVAIGAVLSLRPWRVLMKRALPKTEMIQTQILLCAAAAVITCVIGDSLAKAFGLVGLGGFVRFRSGLKDPRDAAILFLVIGLGMACGHGSLGLAGVGTAFVFVLLFVIDLLAGPGVGPSARVRLSATADDLAEAERSLRRALGLRNVLVKSCAVDFGTRQLELDLEESVPGSISAAVNDAGAGALKELRWATVPGQKGQREERV